MGRTIVFFLALCSAPCIAGADGGWPPSEAVVSELQSRFLSGATATPVRSIADLPPAGQRMLQALQGASRVVEFGESWYPGDIVFDGEPLGQHLTSLVSDDYVATLVVHGVVGSVAVSLLLAAPDADWYCLYLLPQMSLGSLFWEAVRERISIDRPNRPACVPRQLARQR